MRDGYLNICKLCTNANVRKHNLETKKVAYTRELPKQDLLNQKYGELTVVAWERVKKGEYNQTVWECVCECGNITKVPQSDLISRKVKSCGCKQGRCKEENAVWTGCGELSGQRWSQIKYNSVRKSRTLDFTITIEEAWNLFEKQNRKCALSGLEICFGARNVDETTASLDRIDSNKGYISSNIQWVHKLINKMKQNIPEDIFKELCANVTNYEVEPC